ncbi:hypothetical protein [Pseudomonas helvetica]|uniref:hypothetical protein n=1 Tax=Pseudomonas helvetica TaxID=3136738 RepID=UPI003266BAE8
MSLNTHFTPLILAGIALLCSLSMANVYFNEALLPVFANDMQDVDRPLLADCYPWRWAANPKLPLREPKLRLSLVKQSPAMANAVKVFCRKK